MVAKIFPEEARERRGPKMRGGRSTRIPRVDAAEGLNSFMEIQMGFVDMQVELAE